MSFRPMLRPGQGFQLFKVLRRESAVTEKGRPHTGDLTPSGEIYGMITQADPKEVEQFKQLGTPITHTIVQRNTGIKAKATDILELSPLPDGKNRRFLVQGEPKNPGELGYFLVYKVEERFDLK